MLLLESLWPVLGFSFTHFFRWPLRPSFFSSKDTLLTDILPIKLFSLILLRSHGVDGEEKSSDATSTKRRHETLLEALGDRKPKVYRFASSELEDFEVEYF